MKRKTIIVLLCVLSLTACASAQAPASAYTPTTVPEFEQLEQETEQTKEPATPSPSPTVAPVPTSVPSPSPEPFQEPPEASEEPETVEEIKEPEETAQPEAITAAALVEKDGTYDLELAQEAFRLVNEIRAEAGLAALAWDDNLYESAKVRALEASVVWSHDRPDGSSWSTVSNVCQGENLAKGYDVAADVVAGWMDSEGHKDNILRDFGRGAVAFFSTENGWFWCEHFGY